MPHSQKQTEPRILPAVGHKESSAVHPAESSLTDPDEGSPKKRQTVIAVAAIIALLVLVTGGRLWWRSYHFVETENAYVSGHVHPVSSRISGVASKVLIDDNQHVREGDVIAELDSADQRVKVEQILAQISTAEQQVIQADAQVAQARAQTGATIAQVTQSSAQLQRAEQDAARYNQLYNTQMKAVSKAELDAANAILSAAKADQAARHDAVAASRAQIAAVESSREVIKAQIKVLQVQLKDAEQQLAYNRIVAPVGGRIGKRSIEVGTRVQPGQQLAAIVQENVWIIANFKETQLARLSSGQVANIVVDAMSDSPLIGRIESFSPASGAQFALLPSDNATGNFTKIVQRVPVKILLRPEDVKRFEGRLVPGMSAVVEVEMNQPLPTKNAGP
jgi:membrane fusion protein, multidrug efflux system